MSVIDQTCHVGGRPAAEEAVCVELHRHGSGAHSHLCGARPSGSSSLKEGSSWQEAMVDVFALCAAAKIRREAREQEEAVTPQKKHRADAGDDTPESAATSLLFVLWLLPTPPVACQGREEIQVGVSGWAHEAREGDIQGLTLLWISGSGINLTCSENPGMSSAVCAAPRARRSGEQRYSPVMACPTNPDFARGLRSASTGEQNLYREPHILTRHHHHLPDLIT